MRKGYDTSNQDDEEDNNHKHKNKKSKKFFLFIYIIHIKILCECTLLPTTDRKKSNQEKSGVRTALTDDDIDEFYYEGSLLLIDLFILSY